MNGAEQAASKPCPECGGQRIVTRYERYNFIEAGSSSASLLVPVVCISCGYTMNYADDLLSLR